MSKRLTAIGALVTEGGVLADIGTDHAYLPVFLALEGIIISAVAADINRGPLSRAEENIRAFIEGKPINTVND